MKTSPKSDVKIYVSSNRTAQHITFSSIQSFTLLQLSFVFEYLFLLLITSSANISHHFKSTAKLILLDGGLEVFNYPVKVSNLVKKNPDCFICNSDEMEFDGLVSAMDGDEELQPGQLYFELPLTFLKQRLQTEYMASLAVKASLALTGRSDHQMIKYGCYILPKKVVVEYPLMFLHEKDAQAAKSRASGVNGEADYCDVRLVKKSTGRSPAAGKGGKFKVTKFTATLSAIVEIEE